MISPLREGTKKRRVLLGFYTGAKLHRFAAEHIGDHALHSTVSTLERTGLRFDRKTITVPTRWGSDTHVTLYWLASESYLLAAQLLGYGDHFVPKKELADEVCNLRSGGNDGAYQKTI